MSKSEVSRRDFLRTASVGAAATGIVAVGGGKLLDTSLGSRSPEAAAGPSLEGSDIFAHVSDAKTGQLTIFVGTKAVEYQDRHLAQLLAKAAQ